jgi:hypothetical protein
MEETQNRARRNPHGIMRNKHLSEEEGTAFLTSTIDLAVTREAGEASKRRR